VVRNRARGNQPPDRFGHHERENSIGHARTGALIRPTCDHVLRERDRREVPAHGLGEEGCGHQVEGALADAGDGIDRGPEIGVEPERLRGAHAPHRAVRVEERAQGSIEVQLRG
jgi:hypothetical protein